MQWGLQTSLPPLWGPQTSRALTQLDAITPSSTSTVFSLGLSALNQIPPWILAFAGREVLVPFPDYFVQHTN